MNEFLYFKSAHPVDEKPMLWRAELQDTVLPELSTCLSGYGSSASLYRLRDWERKVRESLDRKPMRLMALSIDDPAYDCGTRKCHVGYRDNPNPRPFRFFGRAYEEVEALIWMRQAVTVPTVTFGCPVYGSTFTTAAKAQLRSLYEADMVAWAQANSVELVERTILGGLDRFEGYAVNAQAQALELARYCQLRRIWRTSGTAELEENEAAVGAAVEAAVRRHGYGDDGRVNGLDQ